MNAETTLLRQVHPNFIPEGKLSSQAFMPFPRDDGKVSVYDGDQISAADSFKHFTETLDNLSDSIWGVVCSEVSSIGLSSAPDPQIDFPSHSLIDFTVHSQKDFRKLAKKLRQFAINRGCLYPSR